MNPPKMGHHVPDDFPAPIRGLAALSRFVAVLEGIGIGAALFSLIGLALWQFVTRNLRMNGFQQVPAAPEWSDNVLRHSVFLIGFLGAMFATFGGRHLRVDAVTRLATGRTRLVLRIVAAIGASVVCAVMIYAAWVYRQSVVDETPQEGQLFTAARGAMIIVVGMLGMLFHFLVQLAIDATYVLTGREPPGWWISEASHGGEAIVEDEPAATAPAAAERKAAP